MWQHLVVGKKDIKFIQNMERKYQISQNRDIKSSKGHMTSITFDSKMILPVLGRSLPWSTCLCVIGMAACSCSTNLFIPMGTMYEYKEAPPYLTVGLLDLWDAICIDDRVDCRVGMRQKNTWRNKNVTDNFQGNCWWRLWFVQSCYMERNLWET